jgi:hypothetical protein
VIERIDATTPMMNPTDVSYRYPFHNDAGADLAPVDWTDADWDAYQGNAAGVIGAIDRFLRVIDNRRLAAMCYCGVSITVTCCGLGCGPGLRQGNDVTTTPGTIVV